MSAQMVLFGEKEAAPYGYKANGKARRRPVKTFEWPIFDMDADKVPEVAPPKDSPMYELYRQHRAWERIKARRCAELQADWTPREEAHRRGVVTDEAMELDEMVEV